MKATFLLLILNLFFLSSYSQSEQFLGWKRNDVMELNSDKFRLVKTGVTTDSTLTFDVYQISEHYSIITYFDYKFICKLVTDINKNDVLVYAIEDLNKKFKKIGASDWISKDNTISVNLTIMDEYFKIVYKKIN